MASTAAALITTHHPVHRMTLFKSRLHNLCGQSLMHTRKNSVSAICCVKEPTMGEFDEPYKFRIKMQLCYAKQKLQDLSTEFLNNFQREKAKSVAQQQLLVDWEVISKWLFTALFIFGSVFDTIYSISISKELVVPFGLFAGCIIADFLKETSDELLLNYNVTEKTGSTLQLLGIGCFFALLKIISHSFNPGVKVFLLHLANGGLMQILWSLRIFTRKDKDVEESSLIQDASVDVNVS